MWRVVQRVLLLFVSIALALFVLEIGLTLWYGNLFRRGPLELAAGQDSPFVFTIRPGDRANHLAMLREEPVARVPPRGTRRILSYGDSIAEGYRLPLEETYSHLAEALLRESTGERYEVLNMARGHSPSVYAAHIGRDVPALDPMGVVLEIELLNDVPDEAHVRFAGSGSDGLPGQLLSHRYIVSWDGHILAPLAWRGSFFERTKLYAQLSRAFGRMRERANPNPLFASDSPIRYYSLSSDRYFLTEQALERGFSRMFASLEAIHGYLQRRGIHFLLLILPSRDAFETSQHQAASQAIVERAEQRARRAGIPFVSLRGAMGRGGAAELFMDFCHPTARGNQLIAQEIAPLLAAWPTAARDAAIAGGADE